MTFPKIFSKEIPINRKADVEDPYLTKITIINYGKTNMGYYGLKAIDNKGHSHFLVTMHDDPKIVGEKYVLKLTKKRIKGVDGAAITVPPNDHGIIKAHSYHVWNVIISGRNKDIKSLTFQIKFTKKNTFSSKFKSINKRYKGSLIIDKTSNRINKRIKNK